MFPFFDTKLYFWKTGSLEEHELFNDVLYGIKNVMYAHMRDVQLRFEDQYKNLEFELCHRDAVIEQLRHRIQELEGGDLSPVLSIDGRAHTTPKTGSGSTGSSGDIAFVVSFNRTKCWTRNSKTFFLAAR